VEADAVYFGEPVAICECGAGWNILPQSADVTQRLTNTLTHET
jgi:hypothetical protein